MSLQQRRFVDPHMHLWDLNANAWYQFPVPGNDYGFGLKEPFPDQFLFADYQRALGAIDLQKCVHVTAVTHATDVEAENRWISDLAQQHPQIKAIIDTVDLNQSAQAAMAQLDANLGNPLYRGIRLLSGVDYAGPLAQDILSGLQSRGLVYDCVANPGGGIETAAKALAAYPDLVVVLEHTGWPLGLGAQDFEQWKREMAQFAALPHSYCKLSGLGMVVHKNDAEIFQRYFHACISLFGAERCMFASNFPVDLCYGDATSLLHIFEETASRYTPAQADALFAGTAERVYRI